MQRYEQERARARTEQRKHLRRNHPSRFGPVDCACEFQVGRFRKQKGLGCHKTRCYLCKGDKYLGRASHKQKIEALRAAEQLRWR